MLKQLTAMILVLAIANPFCCCFGKENKSSDSPKDSAPVYSCCYQAADEPSNSDPEDDNGPCKNCPCKKESVVSDVKKAEHVGAKVNKSVSVLPEYFDTELRYVATPTERLGFWMRPPPPPQRLYIIHSVFRT